MKPSHIRLRGIAAAITLFATAAAYTPLQYGSYITVRLGDGSFNAVTGTKMASVFLEEWR